jgi:hypothetical protein
LVATAQSRERCADRQGKVVGNQHALRPAAWGRSGTPYLRVRQDHVFGRLHHGARA